MNANSRDHRHEELTPRLTGRFFRAVKELARLALQPDEAKRVTTHERLERMALQPDRERSGHGGYVDMVSPQAEASVTDEQRALTAVCSRPRANSTGFPHSEDPEESPLPTARAEFDG